MAQVKYKSVSQTATSFTPESHNWVLGHSFIESNCHSFPPKPLFPDSLLAATPCVPQCLSHPRAITALHQHTELLHLLCFCTWHALLQVLGAGLLFTFRGGSLQSPCSRYLPPLTSDPSLLLNCCRPMSGLKPLTLCCQVHG